MFATIITKSPRQYCKYNKGKYGNCIICLKLNGLF